MQLTLFLKRVLMLDAASCLGMGALLAPAAGALSPLFGLEPSLLFGAGVALIPTGLFILWVATRAQIRPLFVYLVIAGNFIWVLESLLLVRGATGSPASAPPSSSPRPRLSPASPCSNGSAYAGRGRPRRRHEPDGGGRDLPAAA